MENSKNIIKKFIYSHYYLALFAIITFLFWSLDLSIIGAALLVIIGSISLFFSDDISPLFPSFLFLTIVMNTNNLEEIFSQINLIIVVIAFFIVSLILFIVKKLKEKGKFTIGKQFYWLLIAAVGALISGLFIKSDYKVINLLFVLGYFAAIIIIYVLSVNFIDKERKKYIAKIFLYVAAAVMSEMLFYYLTVPDVNEAFRLKSIDLGWGISNNIAVYLIISAPMILYLSVNNRFSWIYMLLSLITCTGIVFTLSRGCILFAVLLFPFMYIYAFYKSERRTNMLIVFFTFSITLIVLMLIFKKSVWELFGSMINKGFNDSGRIELYKHALNIIKENPIFGIGFFGNALNRVDAHNMMMAHNTLLQILLSVGIFGFLCFIMMYVFRFFSFFNNCNIFKVFSFVSVLIVELYGLMDITFFNIDILMFIYILIGTCEIQTEKDDVITPFITNIVNKLKAKFNKEKSPSKKIDIKKI